MILKQSAFPIAFSFVVMFSLAACGGGEEGSANVSGFVVTRAIVPSDTSPAIEPTIGNHYVALGPASSRIGTLLVFYAGTGSRADQYSLLMRRAAVLGYHVIGLAYHNTESINFDICPGQPVTCHEQARLEILLGIESGYNPPNVNPENAAFERLLRLLQYLNANWPGEGWGTYLDGTGAQPEWRRIAFGGHSQGGGHAAMTAKIRLVRRVLMFAATEPVAWTTAVNFETPARRFFGFVHTAESNFDPIVQSWANLGIPGVLTSTDGAVAPYGNTHRLSTSISVCSGDSTNPVYYHNCPVADAFLPFTNSGIPLFQPVWDYMLTTSAP